MEKKQCYYCKEMKDINIGFYDKDGDEFYCYECVEYCCICNGIVHQMDAFSCDYEDDGVICNNHFHSDCGTEDKKIGWLCDDHKKYANVE